MCVAYLYIDKQKRITICATIIYSGELILCRKGGRVKEGCRETKNEVSNANSRAIKIKFNLINSFMNL